jgi:hypothetical protein
MYVINYPTPNAAYIGVRKRKFNAFRYSPQTQLSGSCSIINIQETNTIKRQAFVITRLQEMQHLCDTQSLAEGRVWYSKPRAQQGGVRLYVKVKEVKENTRTVTIAAHLR